MKEVKALTGSDTHGILSRPEHSILQSSDTLNWSSLYASHQREMPYSDEFRANDLHLIIVHLSGPTHVERRLSGDHKTVKVSKGGLFVLPAHRDFGVTLLDSLETIHLYLKPTLLYAAASELCHGDPAKVEFLPRLGDHDALIEQLASEICNMIADGQSDFFADGMARVLATQLVRRHSTGRQVQLPSAMGLKPHQLAKVRAIIEERMEEPLTIADLAEAAGLSPIHFARQFKRSTGKTPHQHLIDARINRAKQLLAEHISIAEVAYRCGFSHQEHMSRLFRQYLDTTPGAYRRNRLS